MNCPNCGQPVKDGSPFCGNCGAPIPQAPPQEPAAATPPPFETGPAPAAFGAYTPPQEPAPAPAPAPEAFNTPTQTKFDAPAPAEPFPPKQPEPFPPQQQPYTPPQQPQFSQPQAAPYVPPQQPQAPQPQNAYVPPQQSAPYRQPGAPQQPQVDMGQVMQYGTQQPQPKKKKTGLIIGIVIGALVLVGIIVLIAIGKYVNDHIDGTVTTTRSELTTIAPTNPGETQTMYGFTPATTAPYTIASDGSFTKGDCNGVEYVNPWADLRIPVPDGWSEDDAAEYASWESDGIVCGFSATAPDNDSVVVLFFENPSGKTVEEFREKYDETTEDGSVPLKQDPIHSRATIGGLEYLCSDYVFSQGGNEYAESLYVRQVDDRFVAILILGDTIDENDTIMKTINTY